MQVIETSGLGEQTTVDTPSMTLEEFFLDVISKARAETSVNAGVEGSGKIADFLEGESDSEVASRKILQALAEEESAKAPEPEPEPEHTPDVEVLKNLADDEPKVSDDAIVEDKSAKNQAINDILNKK